ncbi:unnamed protein product, partial [Polarella glacialis]
ESQFRGLTKDALWKAFFAKRVYYKKAEPNGTLSEELKRSEDQVEWDLIMEAFRVLSDEEARYEYEERNLAPHARLQLVGLRVMHESHLQDEVERSAKAAQAAAAAAAASATPS